MNRRLNAYAFIDGAYLRKMAADANKPWVDPYILLSNLSKFSELRTWGSPRSGDAECDLLRVTYYDAMPDAEKNLSGELRDYWNRIELLNHTHLGFGFARPGTGSGIPKQRGVDTLIAVNMLVGAFDRLFDVAILVAGDADFVRVVREFRRRGILVALGAGSSVSEDLKGSADRFVMIGPNESKGRFPVLRDRLRMFGLKAEKNSA